MRIAQAELSDFSNNCDQLVEAVKDRDKKKILRLYEEINLMDLALIPEMFLDEYDELVTKGNDILYCK